MLWDLSTQQRALTCNNGHLDVIKMLKITDLNTKDTHGRTPIMNACINGKIYVIKKVRKTYFNVNSDMFQVAKMANEKVDKEAQ